MVTVAWHFHIQCVCKKAGHMLQFHLICSCNTNILL
jgi:hypothetical protein